MGHALLYEWRNMGYAELPIVAQWIVDNLPTCRLFLMSGAMGSGKTTLVRTYLESMGIPDFEGSPTYNYYHLYPIRNPRTCANIIVHIDMARIRVGDEEFALQFEEFQCINSIVFVENYNPQKGLILTDYTNIFLEEDGVGSRRIRIEKKAK